MTHSTNAQSFKYFIDATILLDNMNKTEVKIEIPVRDEDRESVDLGESYNWNTTFADGLISDYLDDNQNNNPVIQKIYDDCDGFWIDYTIRKVLA